MFKECLSAEWGSSRLWIHAHSPNHADTHTLTNMHAHINRLCHLSHFSWHLAHPEIEYAALPGTVPVKEGCPPVKEVFRALTASNTISDNIWSLHWTTPPYFLKFGPLAREVACRGNWMACLQGVHVGYCFRRGDYKDAYPSDLSSLKFTCITENVFKEFCRYRLASLKTKKNKTSINSHSF